MKISKDELKRRIADLENVNEELKISLLEDIEDSVETDVLDEKMRQDYEDLKYKYENLINKYKERFLTNTDENIENKEEKEDGLEEKEVIDIKEI